jgi:hypothetical protein
MPRLWFTLSRIDGIDLTPREALEKVVVLDESKEGWKEDEAH